MALHRLAPELLCMILSSLDSFQDLYSLIRASPACLQAFRACRRITLSSIIRNVLLPESIHHALALLHIPKPPVGTDRPGLEETKAFLDHYLQAKPWSFPKDLSSTVSLTLLVARVTRFIDRFFDSAMETLATFRDHDASWPLSSTERARLQRAFLRFEIYCQVFPALKANPLERFVSADFQFDYFLGRLELWEVEELISVHQYFDLIVGRCIMDFEDEFVRTVLANPHLHAPSNHHLQEDLVDKQENSGTRTEGMQAIEMLDLTNLELFSTDCKSRLCEVAEYMVSLGLEFLEDLMSLDDKQRWDLIRRHSPFTRDFLCEAVQWTPRGASDVVLPEGTFIDDSSLPSKGWIEFKGGPTTLCLSAVYRDSRDCILRPCGYVFWDSGRLLQPALYEAFKKADRMDRSALAKRCYDPTVGESAEKQLKGYRVPKSEWLKLESEFGSTWTIEL
ncbi:hypothetical protein F5Y07DRAFT_371678 [Xylaria sp. FL0933]|nr:hypothetical protein F5Y07DRAFT_371678 [Xylaria sp. FL0933]